MHLLDQENAPQWIDFGATNIQAAKQVGQSFQPSCYDLVRVDVDLTNWGSQGSATAKILRSGSTISTAFTTDLATDGTWSRFDFPSAVDVTPGERLVLQLESDSDPLPLWKYLEDDDTYPYGKRFISGDAKLGDFFFRTYSTSCSTASGRGLPSVPTEYPSDETGTAAPVYCTDDWIAMGYCVSAYKAAYPECKSGWCLESEYLLLPGPTDTCASLKAKICTELSSPGCGCPVVECASEVERYFGCVKEELTDDNLVCDNSLDCCFDGCPTPPAPIPTTPPPPPPPPPTTPETSCDLFCILSGIIGRIIAAIVGLFGGGGGN